MNNVARDVLVAGATLGPAMAFGYVCGKNLAMGRLADWAAE